MKRQTPEPESQAHDPGDWISIPLGGGEDYKFQVLPNMRPGQLIEIKHDREKQQEIIKVKVIFVLFAAQSGILL